jgi:hypothetical protein
MRGITNEKGFFCLGMNESMSTSSFKKIIELFTWVLVLFYHLSEYGILKGKTL